MSSLKGGNELFAHLDEKIIASTKKVLLQNIEFKESLNPDSEASNVFSKYKPINAAYSFQQSHQEPKETKQIQRQTSHDNENAFMSPKVILHPPEKIEMNWREPKRIGPGFANLGNTCFLNSVLQVLTYTAPLVNFANSDEHKTTCVSVGFCMLCEFGNHLTRVSKHHPQNGPIRPMTIIQRLSCISKNFKFGRQEDAHEFLRYVIEAFRKSCLAGKKNLDRFSKETTAINQIFGGFFRSQVTCLSCKKASNTFDPMMELNLDIKESNTIVDALRKTVRTEKLDGENKYSCERCKRKTVALKKGNIHAPPKILTLQLKRFDFQRLFGGKISKDVHFQETIDLSPFLSYKPEAPVLYKLYAVLVHSGFSCNSGHYYCYVKAPNGIWYEMNDSRVSQVGLQTVLRAQAYLLFYSIIGHKATKASMKVVEDRVKALNINKKSFEGEKKNQAPKDVGLPLFKNEPRIVPYVKTDKVKFSLTGSSIQKHENSTKNSPKSNGVPIVKPSGSKGFPKLMKESSLETIRKEYDSESEESSSAEKKSDGSIQTKDLKEPEGKHNLKTKLMDKDKEKELHTENIGKVEVQSTNKKVSEVEAKDDSILSPPKSVSTEALHKKKAKMHHNGTAVTASKFGRWVPVRSLTSSFTPRSVLHRSLSDSVSVEKSKIASNKKEMKRQFSAQVQSTSPNDKVEKSKLWNVEENTRVEPPYGPMTPHVKPSEAEHVRERTTSLTSETGSISTKTGDWDVYDKDLCDTPSAPYVQERHFAGWSVENHVDKKHQNHENRKKSDEITQPTSKVSKMLFDDHEDNRSGKKSKEKLQEEEEKHNRHKKKAKKRRKNEEEKSDEGEEDHRVLSKKSKTDGAEYVETHKSNKKSKKSRKKKKKKKKEQDRDSCTDDEDQERKKREQKKGSLNDSEEFQKNHKKHHKKDLKEVHKHSKKSEKGLNDKGNVFISVDKDEVKNESKEETRRAHKKKKKNSDHEKLRRSSEDHRSKSEKRNQFDEEEDSRYSAIKTPRRVSITTLSTLSAKSDSGGSNGLKAAGHNGSISPKTSSMLGNEHLETENGRNPPSKKSKTDAPVKQWDEKPKISTSWNGSNDKAVLDSLLSKKSKMTTWDDEASETLRHDVSGSSKRNRDRWDDEYDEGKVKKIKKHRRSHSSGTYKDNPFQRFQNRRNFESNKR